MRTHVSSTALERVQGLQERGDLVVLTGAGISAESGIPTFRGKEGYWTVGSREYQPQEMATYAMFQKDPESVWSWYLYRRGICRAAQPNPAHRAVVRLEKLFGERFRLITQNVDGLHLHAGNSLKRTYQIHGNIDYARCAADCGRELWPLDSGLGLEKGRGEPLTDTERRLLRCTVCGGWLRPHVLWFDENYDEPHFRFHSSLAAAAKAAALLVVGTSGATNLPVLIGRTAAEAGALLIDINPEPNLFSQLARSQGGLYLQGAGGRLLPELVELLRNRQV